MSKIGEKPIIVPELTQIEIINQSINVKGKEGQLLINIPNNIRVEKDNNSILIKRKTDNKKTKSLHGLIRSLINNAVIGVNNLWEKKLQIIGTGYRAKLQGDNLILEVGYSHPVVFNKVEGILLSVEGTDKICIRGINKQLVGQVANKIKSIKQPDPYKGKGIRYEGEKIKLKPGKKEKAVIATTK
jgi:large subunit ribosomal protein L6